MSAGRSDVEARERAFFGAYYTGERCNPVGLRLRLERERRALLRAGGGRLGRVLSIGCGDGRFERLLAPHAERVVGLDLAPEAIEAARRSAEAAGARNLEFRCLPVSELDWGERFDTVVCLAFLHHVPAADLPALLRQLRAQLSPGGFLYAQDPSRRGGLRALGRLVLGARYDRYHSPDERELDADELAGALRAAGFASVEIGWLDLTLIPAHYFAPRAPAALMHACRWLDALFCASPLRRFASGFTAVARAERAGGAA